MVRPTPAKVFVTLSFREISSWTFASTAPRGGGINLSALHTEGNGSRGWVYSHGRSEARGRKGESQNRASGILGARKAERERETKQLEMQKENQESSLTFQRPADCPFILRS